MKYKIFTVEHLCRNNGVGDYEVAGYHDWWNLEVTNTGSRKFNKLLIIHELVECMLIEEAGVQEPDIDMFDRDYIKIHPDGEPGEDEAAPYHKEHMHAEFIEKYLAKIMNIDWKDYCKEIENLVNGK